MRYNKIRKMDVSNGPGVRISIFLQGCSFHCAKCFNPETHDFAGGKEFTEDTLNELLKLGEPDYVKGLSILGGEPMHPANEPTTEYIAKAFKEKYPDKSIWVWSGFKYEDYLQDQPAMKYIDYIVDGQFEDDKRNPKLHFRGSSNQRIIDVKHSLEEHKVIEADEFYEDIKYRQ